MGFRKGKGSRKKKATCFQHSHSAWNKGLAQVYTSSSESETDESSTPVKARRLTHQEFARTFEATGEGSFVPSAQRRLPTSPECSSPYVLRPKGVEKTEVQKHLEKKEEDQQLSGYTEVHLPTVVNAVQDSIIQHNNEHPRCTGRLSVLPDLVTKWGLTAILQLKCIMCGFTSERHKLYREVARSGRGRRCAEPNRSLAVGMMCTNIGMAGSQRLFSAIGNTVPSASSMQRQLNSVGDSIRELNEADMARQRTKLQDTLEQAGYPRNTAIAVQCDRQYNNDLRSGRRHTPYAPATQTRDLAAENLTVDKKIIAYNQESKLCKIGELARAKGRDVQCPGHDGCMATLPASAYIGDEKLGGRKLARSLLSGEDSLTIGMVVTDADGRMAEGFSSEMEAATNASIEHCLDTQHINRSVARGISNSDIKVDLAGVHCTSAQRQQAKNRLADSIASRAEHEVRAARDKYGDNNAAVVKAAKQAIPAIIACYQGDQSLCREQSLVCDGEHVNQKYLPKFAKEAFRFRKNDVQRLTVEMRKRMGEKVLIKTRLGLNTQKVESMNHAFVTTYPKHSMTCYRNGANRDHSAIHQVNNPMGDSILLKNEACGVHFSSNAPCLKALHGLNRRQHYFKQRSRSSKFKSRRAHLVKKRYELYDMTRNESMYKKDQMLPK